MRAVPGPWHEGNHGRVITPTVNDDSTGTKGCNKDGSQCLHHRVVASTLEDKAMGAAGEVADTKRGHRGVYNGGCTTVADGGGGSGGGRANRYRDGR